LFFSLFLSWIGSLPCIELFSIEVEFNVVLELNFICFLFLFLRLLFGFKYIYLLFSRLISILLLFSLFTSVDLNNHFLNKLKLQLLILFLFHI
jgi:hypothetical protein